MKNQSSAIEQVDRYIRARYPAIAILSHEESRVMESIQAVAERRRRRVVTWTCTQGLQQVRSEDDFNDWHPDSNQAFDLEMTRNQGRCIEGIHNYNEKAQEVLAKRNQIFDDIGSVLFVIKDIHGFIGNRDRGFDPQVTRWIRDIAARFGTTRHKLIFLSPSFTVPPDLEKTMVVIDGPLPDNEELSAILAKFSGSLVKIDLVVFRNMGIIRSGIFSPP